MKLLTIVFLPIATRTKPGKEYLWNSFTLDSATANVALYLQQVNIIYGKMHP